VKSPIYYNKGMKAHIDLSQLVQVDEPVGWQEYEGGVYSRNIYDPHYFVGFNYWFSNSSEPVRYRRPLKVGPKRWEDLSLVWPGQELDMIGEEIFEVVRTHPKFGAPHTEHSGWIVTQREDSGADGSSQPSSRAPTVCERLDQVEGS